MAVIENRQRSNAEPIPEALRTRIYVLGGESYVTTTIGEDVKAGTGSYLNDVWISRGVGE